MASRRTYVLLAVAAGSYLLGFILCVVGYSIPWLEPKAAYDSAVLSVGLVTSCFKNFKFPQYVDRDQTVFDGCSRVYEPRFDRLKDAVNPDWFENVRRMHFSCILILSLNILLVMGFAATYILAMKQTQKRGRSMNAIVYTKTVCSLWFVPVAVVAILQIVEPSVFHFNYERNSNTFYTTPQGGVPLYYSGGFAVTIVAAIFCIASTVSGVLLFVGICRKTVRVLGENYLERHISGSIHGGSEGGRAGGDGPAALSVAYNRREGAGKTEVDGADLIEKLTKQPPMYSEPVSRQSAPVSYKSEPRGASYTPSSSYTPSRSTAADDRGDRASTTSGSQQPRPVPTPRRSVSSRSPDGLLGAQPPEEQQQPSAERRSSAARSSVHELRSGRDYPAASDERGSPDVAGDSSSRRRYSAGSSYRPTASASAGPPSMSSGSTSGQRQPPGDRRGGGGTRRPDDLPLAHGSLPPSSTSGGSHPPSLASTDISLAASSHYESNPSSGYKPKELAMMRFISDRSLAVNAAAVSRASMEQRRSSSGAGHRASDKGQPPQPTSPAGPKSPPGPKSGPAAAVGSAQPPTPGSTSAKKNNSIYVSY